MTTIVDPAQWTNQLNPNSTDLSVGGSNYYVENPEDAWSLTAPSAGVLRFEVRSGDRWATDPTSKNRSEISGLTQYAPGTQVNVSYGMMIEPGAANTSSWLVTGQFHQVENNGYSPPFEINFNGNEHMGIAVNYLTSSGAQSYRQLWTDSQNIVRGETYQMSIQATFDTGNGSGHLVVIRNGVTLVNYTGPMGFPGMSGVYWKEGVYRAASGTTEAIDYSNLSITTGSATHTAPTTAAESYAAHAGAALSVSAAQGVLANDTDHNSQTLTATLAANGGPAHGALTLNADGSFTYTPTAGYVGTDSFTYVAKDSLSSSAPTTVTLNVAGQTPTANPSTYAAHAGQTLTEDAAHGLLAGAVDPNGLALSAALANNGGPSHGTVALNADGSFTYTPTLGYAGADSFTYVVKDSVSSSAATTVTLNVIDPPPVTQTAAYAVAGDVGLSVSADKGVLASAVDGNGLPMTAALANNGGPSHGAVVLNADGSFTYTPALGFVGTDSFTYVASDSLSASAPTTVNITVAPQAIAGGTGNDVYHVYNSADQVSVAAGTPNETVISTADYVLPTNVQNLVLNGSGLTGTANGMNDTLTSTGGPNTLVGGAGVDTFYVNNTGDKVVVASSHNSDVIISTVSYALSGGVHCLRLVGAGLTATGDAAGHNYITSINGGNTLIGGAGGNDVFAVTHSNDAIVVAAGTVNETVRAWSSFNLSANVQNLAGQGGNAITLVGNTMNNVITANGGADTLTGGGGSDTFVVAPGQKMETITDFSSSDKIDISAYLAKGLNPTFHDFSSYSTVSFSTGETITLLGVHASSLAISGHYVV